jgi:hypothetical protein
MSMAKMALDMAGGGGGLSRGSIGLGQPTSAVRDTVGGDKLAADLCAPAYEGKMRGVYWL